MVLIGRWKKWGLTGLSIATLGLGNAHAQTDQQWCRRAWLEIRAYEQALEEIRVEREQGISKLQAQFQPPARRNLYNWYWQRQRLIDRNTQRVNDKCTDQTRLDPDALRVAPAPAAATRRPTSRPPQRLESTPYNRQPRVYPPYRGYDPSRPQVPADPFSG